jgi:hypothetical protein
VTGTERLAVVLAIARGHGLTHHDLARALKASGYVVSAPRLSRLIALAHEALDTTDVSGAWGSTGLDLGPHA